MKVMIVSLDDLFKRLGVNAEKKRPQNRSLWDATSDGRLSVPRTGYNMGVTGEIRPKP